MQLKPEEIPDLTTKGLLAKLLAKENITVVRGNYSTASFDVANRILYLPLFNNTLSKDVADMLVGHEVGHALWTPHDAIEKFKTDHADVPFSYLNILEDIRIERMIQEMYPGLIPCFRRAYQEFVERDFFRIKGKDISKLNLADRLNIKAKCGSLVDVPFSPEELKYLETAQKAQSYEEILELTLELNTFIKAQVAGKDKKPKDEKEDSDISPELPAELPERDPFAPEEPPLDDSQEDEDADSISVPTPERRVVAGDSDEDSFGGGRGVGVNEPEEEPSSEYEGAQTDVDISKLSEERELRTRVGVYQFPTVSQLRAAVIPYQKLAEYRKRFATTQTRMIPTVSEVKVKHTIDMATNLLNKLKKDSLVLVNEFNIRKAAHNYQRTSQAKTGRIDANQLHKFKTSEDIFKILQIESHSTNHGMVMFVDYSSSMESTLAGVLNQVITLALFCRAVEIPFAVYGFTNSTLDDERDQRSRLEKFEWNPIHGTIKLKNLSVFELVSSCLPSKSFEEAIRGLAYRSVGDPYNYMTGSQTERTGGTPLNEAIMVAHEIVRTFKVKHDVENMNVVFLTDGEGCDATFNRNPDAGRYAVNTGVLFGRQVTVPSLTFRDMYGPLVENLKETMKCKVFGFYLYSSTKRVERCFFNNKSISSEIHDDGFIQKEMHGFDAYFFVPSRNTSYEQALKNYSAASVSEIARELVRLGKAEQKKKIILRKLAKLFAE